MITEIGIAAGDIWHYLDQHGESSLSQMTGHVEKSRDLLLMSLGWLAREGHVVVREQGREFFVFLRK